MLNIGPHPKLLSEEACDRVIKREIPLELTRSYVPCCNNDFLYLQNDTSTIECPKCLAARTAPASNKNSERSIKIMSIGDKIAELLACEEFRDGIESYTETLRSNQEVHYNQGTKVFRDIFDGEIYETLIRDKTINKNINNIFLKLDVDGFTCSNSRTSMTMVNAVILSLDPSQRYTKLAAKHQFTGY